MKLLVVVLLCCFFSTQARFPKHQLRRTIGLYSMVRSNCSEHCSDSCGFVPAYLGCVEGCNNVNKGKIYCLRDCKNAITQSSPLCFCTYCLQREIEHHSADSCCEDERCVCNVRVSNGCRERYNGSPRDLHGTHEDHHHDHNTLDMSVCS